jgi:hypothetical protein
MIPPPTDDLPDLVDVGAPRMAVALDPEFSPSLFSLENLHELNDDAGALREACVAAVAAVQGARETSTAPRASSVASRPSSSASLRSTPRRPSRVPRTTVRWARATSESTCRRG